MIYPLQPASSFILAPLGTGTTMAVGDTWQLLYLILDAAPERVTSTVTEYNTLLDITKKFDSTCYSIRNKVQALESKITWFTGNLDCCSSSIARLGYESSHDIIIIADMTFSSIKIYYS
jgi:hypothetical protein